MAEKKEYPPKMPLAPVDDATPAPSKTGASRLSRPTPKTSKSSTMQSKPEPKTPRTPSRPLTSDELERRYDKLRQKDLNAASMTGRPTDYKKGGSVSSASKRADGCATKGKTKGRFV